MARLTRQQLKKDELAVRFTAIREFLFQNQRKIAIVSGAALLGIGVLFGGFLYLSSRETQAGRDFAAAMATFHAPVSATQPPNTQGQYFKTAAEKYQLAYQEFTDVAENHSWVSQGRLSRYYAALCEAELGKTAEAEKDLKAIAEGRDRELASLAKMVLAGIYMQSGRNAEAEKLYQDLQSHPTDTVPKATVELALAEFYQKTKPSEATALYKKIQTEYAGSTAGDQATRMLQGPAQ